MCPFFFLLTDLPWTLLPPPHLRSSYMQICHMLCFKAARQPHNQNAHAVEISRPDDQVHVLFLLCRFIVFHVSSLHSICEAIGHPHGDHRPRNLVLSPLRVHRFWCVQLFVVSTWSKLLGANPLARQCSEKQLCVI